MKEIMPPRQRQQRFWSVTSGNSPVVGTAIHDGHDVRHDLIDLMALNESQRLREEDPFTGDMVFGLSNHVVVHRSRFEVDINRSRQQAVYLNPAQAWGLHVWKRKPDETRLFESLRFHDEYYSMLEALLERIEKRHGAFVVMDIHSYNHRRGGAEATPSPQQEAPDINIGTYSMDRNRWAEVVDATIHHLASTKIGGRFLDVRENIAFQGKGEQTRFVHERFPENGCAIAIEFKKIFMDEWTGQPDVKMVGEVQAALTSLEPLLENILRGRR